jgi:hypothetical protein
MSARSVGQQTLAGDRPGVARDDAESRLYRVTLERRRFGAVRRMPILLRRDNPRFEREWQEPAALGGLWCFTDLHVTASVSRAR